jgi:hypothetical protein
MHKSITTSGKRPLKSTEENLKKCKFLREKIKREREKGRQNAPSIVAITFYLRHPGAPHCFALTNIQHRFKKRKNFPIILCRNLN